MVSPSINTCPFGLECLGAKTPVLVSMYMLVNASVIAGCLEVSLTRLGSKPGRAHSNREYKPRAASRAHVPMHSLRLTNRQHGSVGNEKLRRRSAATAQSAPVPRRLPLAVLVRPSRASPRPPLSGNWQSWTRRRALRGQKIAVRRGPRFGEVTPRTLAHVQGGRCYPPGWAARWIDRVLPCWPCADFTC